MQLWDNEQYRFKIISQSKHIYLVT